MYNTCSIYNIIIYYLCSIYNTLFIKTSFLEYLCEALFILMLSASLRENSETIFLLYTKY